MSQSKFLETVNIANRVLAQKCDDEVLTILHNLAGFMRTKPDSMKRTALMFACLQTLITKTLGYKAYNTQLLAGYYLKDSKVVELKTGEGKTLASIFPVLVKVLMGNVCHLATVNDYLAQRDQEWARPIGNLLNVSLGLIQSGSPLSYRAQAYAKNVTYMNTSEVGFDQMRDTLCVNTIDQIQSKLDYILIDEIDSVLIDSARTPLLLSGQRRETTQQGWVEVNQLWYADELVRVLRLGEDFEVNSKQKSVYLTPSGLAIIESVLGIPDIYSQSTPWVSRILNSLKARLFYQNQIDYITKAQDQEIILLDQITGRALPGRRWSEGLHQAVEAKEGFYARGEPDIIASTTYQNVFSCYASVAGMSGTVAQAADEFDQIYGLTVALLPTNRPSMTTKLPALIYSNELTKCRGLVTECRLAQLQDESPMLVATLDIERSELISELFAYNHICHQLLNARPERAFSEAEIVSQAGRRNMVTVSTNMAGRGTDILLGGNSQACLKSLEHGFFTRPYWAAPFVTEHHDRPDFPQHCLAAGSRFRTAKASRDLFLRKIWRLSRQPLLGGLSRFSLNIPLWSLSCAEREFVRRAGGLYVLCSEKSESGRVDQQLLGRTGRQGDPGQFRFILSLEDKIVRQVGLTGTGLVDEFLQGADPLDNSALYGLFIQAQTKVESLFASVRQQTFKDQTILNYYKSQVLTDRQGVVRDKVVANWILLVFSTAYRRDGTFLDVPSLEQLWLCYDSRRALTTLWYSENIAQYLERFLLLNLLDASWRQFQEVFLALKKGLVWKNWGRRDLLTGYIDASQRYFASQAQHYQETLALSLD